MKKITLALGLASLLATASIAAESTTNTKGAYVGLGGGLSLGGVSLTKDDTVSDGTNSYDVSTMGDSSAGYVLYGGYQFNKIIAVEASFTGYGSFSDDVKIKNTSITKTFKTSPMVGAVYANAGYTFDNGVRPFGQLGLGYMTTSQSDNLSKLNNFDDSFMTIRFGLGVEYAPASLNGFGFRAAYIEDINMDANAVADDQDGNLDTDAILTRYYGMLYIGAQYKF